MLEMPFISMYAELDYIYPFSISLIFYLPFYINKKVNPKFRLLLHEVVMN